MQPDYFALDTAIFAHITKLGTHSFFYRRVLDSDRLAASFQVKAELLNSGYSARRAARLDRFTAITLWLPHSDATNYWYARTAAARRKLRRERRRGAGAGDADIWIISSSLEHELPLLSHDAEQIALARMMGLPVYTALPPYRGQNPT